VILIRMTELAAVATAGGELSVSRTISVCPDQDICGEGRLARRAFVC